MFRILRISFGCLVIDYQNLPCGTILVLVNDKPKLSPTLPCFSIQDGTDITEQWDITISKRSTWDDHVVEYIHGYKLARWLPLRIILRYSNPEVLSDVLYYIRRVLRRVASSCTSFLREGLGGLYVFLTRFWCGDERSMNPGRLSGVG